MWFLVLCIFARIFWGACETLVKHPPGLIADRPHQKERFLKSVFERLWGSQYSYSNEGTRPHRMTTAIRLPPVSLSLPYMLQNWLHMTLLLTPNHTDFENRGMLVMTDSVIMNLPVTGHLRWCWKFLTWKVSDRVKNTFHISVSD